ncbi:nitrilase-related carbon-nitrogen hydrolase, partial [Arthrospira platensis SPKY1]|nr:nitrilase-related carbon-nitrogen hydrolase [Arthrospira platensis SPKY1]
MQWQMRHFPNLDALTEQMEYFIDTVSAYKCDFILFPELFNAPLMADYNHLPEPDAIRKLSEFTIPLRDRFMQFAISYNVNILTGSMPWVEDGNLYNVGFICHRNGTFDRYVKLHITPNEVSAWGMVGGNELKV